MKKTYQNNNDTPDYFKQPPKDNEKVLQTFCGRIVLKNWEVLLLPRKK